nr:basement membrane-specific heparan sulfate proteoglycan core protein [Aedes albopictus]
MFRSASILSFVLPLFLGYSYGLELQSGESTNPRQLTAEVQHGKRLKLIVENVNYTGYRWTFNGTYVSEKCEVKTIGDTSSTLICSDIDWSDEGLYEYQGITWSGQSEKILSVYVKVVACKKSTKHDVELIDKAAQKKRECFCSGITDRCEMADYLFRKKIVIRLLNNHMISSKWSSNDIAVPLKYYSLPMKGNLLMSYGGFLVIPAMEKRDDGSPDIVLQGNEQTLVFNSDLGSSTSGELNRRSIQMTEQGWRDLNGRYVSRNTFMTVLSKVKDFYIRSSAANNELEPLDVVLDSADYKDHGLGKVTTVEKCECRVGYVGLSCEKCSRKYYRRHAVGPVGVCVSFKETWDLTKESIERHQRLEEYRNQLRTL